MNVSQNHTLYPLFQLAQQDPDRQILSFVDDQGRDSETRTAQEFVNRVTQLAAYLQEACGLRKGDVALLIYPPSMEFVEAFAACLACGIVAAPVYPPNLAHSENDLARLRAIAQQSGAKAMLTNRSYRWAVRLEAAKGLLGEACQWPALPWYVTQGLNWYHASKTVSKVGESIVASETTPLRATFPETEPALEEKDDLALLQFTSGSTGVPKGVRLTHKNLSHQLDFNAEALNMKSESRFVMWVPQYHDLGLISGILSALRGNGRLWFMCPFSFLKRPALWFDTIHRVRATHTAAPNFGYELITRKTNPEMRTQWNLSCLERLMSAAEPIVPGTIDQFLSAFRNSGLSEKVFCPAYGLAEHTVGVTVGGRHRIRVDRKTLVDQQRAQIDPVSGDMEIVGCGAPIADVKVRIVCPKSGMSLKDSEVGEIWVQSDSVADGYQGLEELTETTFRKTIPGEKGTWLSTGDLGFLHANELFITGRKKDLIILNGRNFQPEDLEEAIRHIHPKIRAGGVVAFSVPGNATEKLVVIAEVLNSSPVVRQEIIAIIRKKISEIWKVQATIGLLAPKSLKKTTSGKIQRAACRQAWLEKKFSLLEIRDVQTRTVQVDANSPPMAQQLDEIKIEDRVEALVDVIKKLLPTRSSENTADIGIDDFLPDSGVDSLGSTELLHALEGMLHHSLPATLFIEHPTLRSAAARILSELGIEHLAGEANVSAPEGLPFRPPHRGMAPGRTRIAIIGGGVGGLVSALELVRLGFRDIVLFEESDQCGGKVKTVREENELIELGANFFGDTCQNILGLAREMKCEIVPNDTLLKFWDEKHGLADAPSRSPCKKWAQSVIRASRQPVQSPHPFPSMTEGLDQPFNAFLKEKNLYPIHPLFQFDWNAMGYGLDDEELSSYVIAYLQVAGSVSNTCFMKNGNQELWTRLAEYLEKTWGVTFRYRCKISRATPDAEGVTLYTDQEGERFDEVILAIPPDGIEKILPENDPLQEIVTQFEYYGYTIQSFKAEDLKGNSVFTAGSRQGILFPEFSVIPGKPILIGPCHRHEGWFISGHISAVSSRKTNPMNAEELADELAQTLKKMNVKVDSWGPSHTWNYFPHLRTNASQILRKAEALQGTRHIWTTGSWISFETTEHVARHAQHLVQTCFEPSWNGKMAKTILLY